MRYFVFAFMLVATLYVPLSHDQAFAKENREKEGIYDRMSSATCRLEYLETVIHEGSDKKGRPLVGTRLVPWGTGFFIGIGGEIFIVTARHVAEADQDLRSRITTTNLETGETAAFLLKLPHENWVFHDAEGNEKTRYVDVAAMKIPRHWKFNLGIIGSSWFYEGNIRPPSKILVFGFPSNIGFELQSQRPISRIGIISMCSDELFIEDQDGKYWPPKICLIDTDMFHGNSGSPVLSNPIDGKYQLLGLVSGANFRMDYGIMEPISRITAVPTFAIS